MCDLFKMLAKKFAECDLSGDVIRAPSGLMHGKTSPVFHTNAGILEGMEK